MFTDYTHSFFLKAHTPIPPTAHAVGFLGADFVKYSCLTANELIAYGNKSGTLYGWNVSDIQSMDMSLRELGVKRAPQSWMYLQVPNDKTF